MALAVAESLLMTFAGATPFVTDGFTDTDVFLFVKEFEAKNAIIRDLFMRDGEDDCTSRSPLSRRIRVAAM